VPHTPPIDFDGDGREIREKVAGVTGGKTGDFVYELDMQVGKLIKKLEDTGLADTTLIFFTSDNGALWPRVCEYGDPAHDNNGPLRDYKASVYEGGHRVPFIVKWPKRVKPGSVSDELILAQDWVATMYELTGQSMAEDQAMDSTSLLSLITQKKNGKTPHHPFVLYQAGYAFDGAIRQGHWVLTVDRKNEATELYNLDNDLAQEKNLIDRPERRDLIERLHAKFLKHNDHNEETRDPRTTEAFRVGR
jgi:arylsulfatase A-like enzyme